MAKDYADQLIMESRNNVHHKSNYTHECRCWGKCFDEYKKQAIGMSVEEFERLFGAKERQGASHRDGNMTRVYYGPWKNFSVREAGIWTTITCPDCDYSEFWAAGDGDERF